MASDSDTYPCSTTHRHSGRTTFEWNSMIRRAQPHHALSLYARSMLFSSARPNKFTFTFLLRACLHLPLSPLRRLHAHLTLLGLHPDPFLRSALIAAYAHSQDISTAQRLCDHRLRCDVVVRTALVSAYARCAMPDAARAAFDAISRPNPVSWAALLSAYSRAGRHRDTLSAFHRMRRAGVEPTEAALVSALTSSARLGSLVDGQRAHHCVVLGGRSGLGLGPALGTALLEMYARCGRMDVAGKVFDTMPRRDQPAWAAMISALAAHGQSRDALLLFERMVGSGLYPDHVTWVGVLHACSHAGLVAEARGHFERMARVYGMAPRVEHYGCIVDALGRAGQVEDAWELVRSMPVEPDERVLHSLLSACCAHGYVGRAERVAQRLVAMDAGHPSSYVMLSNTYAGLGRWDDVARVRKLMRDRGVPKAPGNSAVE